MNNNLSFIKVHKTVNENSIGMCMLSTSKVIQRFQNDYDLVEQIAHYFAHLKVN